MRRVAVIFSVLFLALSTPGVATADHEPPGGTAPRPGDPVLNQSGGEWEIIGSFLTGNPHTDLDFFTQDGETYAAVGTLATGGNKGGQTIVKLTENGEVSLDTLEYVSGHPSATCVSNPANALGLQHDAEVTPKAQSDVPTNWTDGVGAQGDAQLLIDATDARGRCHDQGPILGLSQAPLGGLEIVDITDVANPKEIHLTTHIGEAHTVNIDPRRPHIAYAVSSDSTSVDMERDPQRQNEMRTFGTDPLTGDPVANPQRFRLDGFEVVDMSSCMTAPYGDLPADADLATKRADCRPDVYRYRWQTTEMALGHTNQNAVYGCHELEIFPDDRLACGSGAALIMFDMSGAFDDNGTPDDFTDDTPVGDPLPCAVRDSSSAGDFATAAKITDCAKEAPGTDVVADTDEELSIPSWIRDGARSLEGVEWLGSAHHQGRQGTGEDLTDPAYGAAEDIDFNHEAELTHSGQFLMATDERGGGVLPPGATCFPSIDNPFGNGGIHTYEVGALQKNGPGEPEDAWKAYALTPEGDKAIVRAPINTKPQGSTCTAHVFQQIPGQNRIFMGWYSQGTQVFDYKENPDGTFEWGHVGHMTPFFANEWVSHVFKQEENDDGTVTYYGVAGDFLLGDGPGRNSIDVWKATLPAVGTVFEEDTGGGGRGGDEGDADDAPGALPATGGSLAIPGALALLGAAAVFGRARRRRTS